MKINNQKIVDRWNGVMECIGCEHVAIPGEVEGYKEYYAVEDGIPVEWMINEAEYWLSCYYEGGNSRCEDRHEDAYSYAAWRSETGKLKRLINRLKKENPKAVVVEWVSSVKLNDGTFVT